MYWKSTFGRSKGLLLFVTIFMVQIALSGQQQTNVATEPTEGELAIEYLGFQPFVILTVQGPTFVPQGDPVKWRVYLPTDASEANYKLDDGDWQSLPVARSFRTGSDEGMEPGLHTLYAKYETTYGVWSDTEQWTVEVFERTLPILYIETERDLVNKEHVLCEVRLKGLDGTEEDIDWLNAEINYRGDYSLALFDKKSLSLETQRRVEVLDMRFDDDWLLTGDWLDPTQLRNKVAYELYDAASSVSPNVKHVASQHVEVILNGQYYGTYLLSERIDRKLLQLKRWDDNDEYHSVVYKCGGAQAFTADPQPFNSGWSLKEPLEHAYWEPLQRVTDFVRYADDEEFHRDIGLYFDTTTLIYQYIHTTLIGDSDRLVKNMYVFANASENGDQPPLAVLPWDFDAAFGAWGRTTWPPDYDVTDWQWRFIYSHSYLYERLFQSDEFKHLVLEEYLWARQTIWTDELIFGMIDEIGAEISEAVIRNHATWPRPVDADPEETHSTDYSISVPSPVNFHAELLWLKDWLSARLVTLDASAQTTLDSL